LIGVAIPNQLSSRAALVAAWRSPTIWIGASPTTFWMGVLGFLKAPVWPVFLVMEALKVLGA